MDTVYTPHYFEEMKGVKHDISVVNSLVKYRFPALHEFLVGRDLAIDNTILSWTICLFMNMNLYRIRRKNTPTKRSRFQ